MSKPGMLAHEALLTKPAAVRAIRDRLGCGLRDAIDIYDRGVVQGGYLRAYRLSERQMVRSEAIAAYMKRTGADESTAILAWGYPIAEPDPVTQTEPPPALAQPQADKRPDAERIACPDYPDCDCGGNHYL